MVIRFLGWLLGGGRGRCACPPPIRVAAVAPPPVPAPYPTDAPWGRDSARELCGVVPRTNPDAWRSN